MRFFSTLFLFCLPALCQNNYEIQVYSYDTVKPGQTMLELHSNFTFQGTKTNADGLYPTNHQLHETVEITHGFTDWFETGFYIFTNAQSSVGWDFVGTHIRPRFRAPEEWHWPVGVSISNEIGYVRRPYSTTLWDWEIRPIVDKQIGAWYLSFNPSFDRALQGPDTKKGFEFSPNFKIGYDINKKVNAGFEYYGALGPVTGFDRLHDQQQQLIPCVDLNLSPNWEFNAGVGVGMTSGTDHLLVKMIIGYRFKI
ncbi:MAG TPA: hypothetical protein VGV35_20485 [Bryobacteraceae bacterium]|nr:hypothetical protein [Bryobacteraceae bacterium]